MNQVTPALFKRYPTAAALARATTDDLEPQIQSTGFFRNKAKAIRGMAQALVEKHGGKVPKSMDELVELAGVGRKTANVVLGNAFGQHVGIVVDTHVGRLSQRLGLTKQSAPEKIELDLMPLFPKEDWCLLSHLLIFHGRRICVARLPKCGACVLSDICPSSRV